MNFGGEHFVGLCEFRSGAFSFAYVDFGLECFRALRFAQTIPTLM
jgi:hypothetical protein